MKIVEYAKAHPWQIGAVVVIGGIIFIMIFSGGGSSGDSSSGAASRPSDAEIAANAQIAAAQITASAAAQSAQIGAGVQLNSDNKAAEVAMTQITAQRDLGLATINAQSKAIEMQIAGDTAVKSQQLQTINSLPRKAKRSAYISLVTGQPTARQQGESFSSIVGSVSNAAGTIGSLFSDSRLKENIVYLGDDKNGNRIYEYNYKGSKTKRRGPMADDLAARNSDIVFRDPRSGFLKLAHL